MPERIQGADQKVPGSFANLLASFTSKLEDGSWDDSDLADDVSTITYEQALRATRLIRTAESATNGLIESTSPGAPDSETPKSEQRSRAGNNKAKTASITIRVTGEEHAKLHERAVAAGLSVSAYLRSCIFEAEDLRSQVKEALARMQSSSQTAPTTPEKKAPRNWRRSLFPVWSRPRAAGS